MRDYAGTTTLSLTTSRQRCCRKARLNDLWVAHSTVEYARSNLDGEALKDEAKVCDQGRMEVYTVEACMSTTIFPSTCLFD